MDEPRYRSKLEKAGNIGVALGQVSNGLVTIDLDHESYVDAFLAVNPLLRNTLRTTAQRGCNVWLRCTNDYPRSCKLRNRSGDEIGEWRADRNQTIITGTHPDDVPYRFVVESPATAIDYGGIVWPDVIQRPGATESQRAKGVREAKVVSVGCGLQIQALCNVDRITQVAPTDYHQNNASLFKLGRLVRSCEGVIRRLASGAELEFVFNRWCLVAHRFWRTGLTRDDYWAEFLQAYYYARIGLDQDPLKLALNRARTMPLPEVAGFSDERVKLLSGLCDEMQRIVGDNSFFLPTRKLGGLLGVHWSTVARWLVALEALRVICLASGEVRKRGGTRSPRYHYGAPVQTSVETAATSPAINQLNHELARPLLTDVQLSNEPKESVTTAAV